MGRERLRQEKDRVEWVDIWTGTIVGSCMLTL